MASKQNQLVQTLLDQNQQLNATQLANSLGVSVRTVHNYINAVNAQYPDAIVSTPTGYRIAPAMAQQMLHQSPNDIPQNAQDRCTYILNRLVQKGGSLNLYDLCDEIYISATTFHGLMGKMRRLTREYDLSLAVSGDTVTLTGSERNKRRLLSGLLYHESASAFTSTDSLQAAFPSIDIEKIRADVMDVLNENHYFINDYSLLNLLLHIAIAINRVQNGCVYTEAPSTMHPLDPQNERLEWPVTVLVYVSGTGAVQGQFLCPGEVSYRTMQDLEEMSCVPREDLLKYAKGRRLSGWIVQSPEKFDAPSPLAEFGLDRPPMSWQYVEIPDAAEE